MDHWAVTFVGKERARRTTPRRKNDPAGMRARILDAASTLFQLKGYNATSVQEVAAAAGVTGGALHHHFATKKELGLGVIRERVASSVEETWIAPLDQSPKASDAVFQIFESIAAKLDQQGGVQGCPVNNLTIELAYGDPDFREALGAIYDQWRNSLTERLAAAGCTRPEHMSNLVIASFSGAITMAKAEQRSNPLRDCAEEVRRLLEAD